MNNENIKALQLILGWHDDYIVNDEGVYTFFFDGSIAEIEIQIKARKNESGEFVVIGAYELCAG